jgi:hypothetical protein
VKTKLINMIINRNRPITYAIDIKIGLIRVLTCSDTIVRIISIKLINIRI